MSETFNPLHISMRTETDQNRLAQRESNHKSVPWSLCRMFLLRRLLTLVTRPGSDIPVKDAVKPGGKLPEHEHIEALVAYGVAADVANYCLAGTLLTVNYQQVQSGMVVVNNSGQSCYVESVLTTNDDDEDVAQQTYIVYRSLVLTGIDEASQLPVMSREPGSPLHVCKTDHLKYTCYSYRSDNTFIITLENS